jgi:methylmalonyl-CoA/ethylmalonyl-CoA epimerase
VVEALAGMSPFQIAFVVHDLEAAARRFDVLLQAAPWRVYLFDETTARTRLYNGEPGDWSLLLALNDRHPQYELVQPVAGASIHGQWLEERGESFHHVGYVVDSIDAVAAELQRAGHEAVMEVSGFGADGDGRGVYFDTVDAVGFFLEIVEPPARMPAPRFTL